MRVSNSLDPDQYNTEWVQTVCKGNQETTKFPARRQKVKDAKF